MSKTKALKELIEESPEQIAKIIRSLKGEADDAATKLGSGKNLEELKKAQEAIAEQARTSQPPAYPKNVVQDELANTQGFKLEGAPYTKEAVMVPEGSSVPAIRKQTLPEVIETTATKVDEAPVLTSTPSQMMSKASPNTLAETAEALKGSVDDALTPGMSLNKKLGIAAGATGTGAALMSMNGKEQPQLATPQQPIVKVPTEVAPQIATKKEQKIEKDQGISKVDTKVLSNKLDQIMASLPKDQQPKTQEEADQMKMDYATMLVDAQRTENQQSLLNNLLRAGTTIGAAIAGVKPDYSGVESLEKQAGRGVAQIKQLMETDKAERELDNEKKMADPNSDISKQLRSLLAKAGYPVAENVSAKQLKDMGINPYNLLAQDKQQQTTLKAAELKEGKNKQSFITGAQRSLMKPYQDFQKVNSAYESLQKLANDPSIKPGAKDVAMLYDFIKNLDPGSVVREGEIALMKQGYSKAEAFEMNFRKIINSDILSPSFRQSMVDIAKMKKDQAEQSYREIAQPFIVNAAGLGLDESEMNKFDYLSARQSVAPQQAPSETYTPKQEAAIKAYADSKKISREEAIQKLKSANPPRL
jgi:hypothetical protein